MMMIMMMITIYMLCTRYCTKPFTYIIPFIFSSIVQIRNLRLRESSFLQKEQLIEQGCNTLNPLYFQIVALLLQFV